ncbi:MAG: hypothetical protein COW65_00555 [Cytophagales bacterium CG18_big_fil_WC_8_21_14_2_50_42_9]|nr:MAG: hypothetical protein COW65_00555 [Cytophagales bacterium CG18_big_fil_WC_8_21_14_2_50_42_9]
MYLSFSHKASILTCKKSPDWFSRPGFFVGNLPYILNLIVLLLGIALAWHSMPWPESQYLSYNPYICR